MKNLLLSLALVFGICVSSSLGCSCVDMRNISFADKVRSAVKDADAVFLGKADRFEWVFGVPNFALEIQREKVPSLTWESRTAVFKVDRLWKGPAETEVFIASDTTRNSDGSNSSSSCDYTFEEGKTYLVFAYQDGWYLKNRACSFTRREDQIKEILPLLGAGKSPVKPVK